MFDAGKFGSSFRGGPLNGFDVMVMSDCAQPKPSKSDISYMAHFLVSNHYISPEELENYSDDEIIEVFRYYM